MLSRALIIEPLEENSDQDLVHDAGAPLVGKMLATVSRTVAHVLGYWVEFKSVSFQGWATGPPVHLVSVITTSLDPKLRSNSPLYHG